jgi:hypothetical protein
VNGFGTEAKEDLNGYSILVINPATVHIHGSIFINPQQVKNATQHSNLQHIFQLLYLNRLLHFHYSDDIEYIQTYDG